MESPDRTRTERGKNSDFRSVAISVERSCLLRDGREIRLRGKTFQVLVYLHEHHGQLVTKDALFRAVWPGVFVSDDSLTKCVREIRRALDDRDHELLKTVARRGFILDAELAPVSPPQLAGPPHNLPAPLTRFIGREREVGEVGQVLSSTRLLTLTGAGGCGKTRLAFEVARQLVNAFADGVWFADLAPLGEPSSVARTVASVLDIRQAPNRSLVQSMADQLRPRRVLLLLDNCEHLIAAASELAETLLRAAPGLTILATSREALGIDGETAWRVPSLNIPQAVALLVERAAAVDSSFAVTNDNASTVTEVCRRLDGIPLAIELAAAKLKVLSIEQIHARLDDRFQLLARTERPVGRQQTLEAAIDWSYELLSEPERELLRRLSPFAGGWTLEAAEHVGAGGSLTRDDVLPVMTRLVDKSLVMVERVEREVDGPRRYRLLESVRHYARERLQQSGEADGVRARHFDFFIDLARRAEPEVIAANQLLWLDRLQIEHDNLRAALDWRLAADQPDRESVDLAAALHWFWVKRAYYAEGQHYLERALGASRRDQAPARTAQALAALGSIVFFQGDFQRADGLLAEGATLARAAGAFPTVAFALGLRTMAAMEGGQSQVAAQCAVESRDAARSAGQPWLEGFSLTYFAYEALFAGDVDRAGELNERLLASLRAQGELWGTAIVLFDLALLRVVQQRHAEARALSHEGIAIGQRFGDRRAIAWFLGVLAGADADEGHALRAVKLRGAMEGLLDSIGSAVQPTYQTWIGKRLFSAIEQELGRDAFQETLGEGRRMSLAEAVDYARC